jgi:uncharacterized OsmC-like protein
MHLLREKYCSVFIILGKTAEILHEIEIIDIDAR